jgi:hypothetical protein
VHHLVVRGAEGRAVGERDEPTHAVGDAVATDLGSSTPRCPATILFGGAPGAFGLAGLVGSEDGYSLSYLRKHPALPLQNEFRPIIKSRGTALVWGMLG